MIKILIVGDSECGKSTLVNLYNGSQSGMKKENMTDFVQRTIDINGNLLYMQIWDVANQDKGSSSLTMQFSRNASGIICVTDIQDQMSLENAIFWKNHINSDREVPCIIAANKFDLVEDLEKAGQALEEFQQEKFLKLFAKKHGFIGAQRISTKYNRGPEEILKTLISEIIDRNSERNPITGEMEFKPENLETGSFKIGDGDKNSIFYEERGTGRGYQRRQKKKKCCK
ncbi:unnamed protein product [Moneuplotes crassus]|uniref:Uncharacterized protein n=1 Tax=Euplotes crassus TaxID=5936 RepID=A0AAD1XRS6_EUPCR|nr:unnamed protein product [Moneuplotes crassus]